MESTSLLTASNPASIPHPEAGFGADDGSLAQCLITYLHEQRETADRTRMATLMAAHR